MLDLSKLLLVSKSGMTRLVDRMEAAGLVVREYSPSDRRATFAAITDRGRQALDEALPAFARGLEEYFSRHLLDPDVRPLRKILRKILSGNGEWEETRCSSCFGVDRAGRRPRSIPSERPLGFDLRGLREGPSSLPQAPTRRQSTTTGH